MERKGLKFSILFSTNDRISKRNGNRDYIFMIALDGRYEMKYARYLNSLLSRGNNGMSRASCRRDVFFFLFPFYYCPSFLLLS